MPAAEPVTPYGDNPSAGHTAALNGIRLYYEIYGEGAPLVVLHGNGGSISALRHQIDYFRTRRQVIAIDSRGHGRSEMGPGRLTYELMADDVAALLAQLHTGPADVLGWSDGGIVALLLALHHPAVVRRIALSGANLSPAGLAPDDLAGMTTELRAAREKLATGDRSRPWDIVCQQLQLMVTQPQLTPADLARIKAPALVLAGEHDIIPAAHTRSIATGLPRAQLHIFPGAGHGALQEVPEAFNTTVEQFFAASP
jgi:pimeloyl-ACP methyl ester carboxylesterase